jgi:hypothetical protein
MTAEQLRSLIFAFMKGSFEFGKYRERSGSIAPGRKLRVRGSTSMLLRQLEAAVELS